MNFRSKRKSNHKFLERGLILSSKAKMIIFGVFGVVCVFAFIWLGASTNYREGLLMWFTAAHILCISWDGFIEWRADVFAYNLEIAADKERVKKYFSEKKKREMNSFEF